MRAGALSYSLMRRLAVALGADVRLSPGKVYLSSIPAGVREGGAQVYTRRIRGTYAHSVGR